MFTVVSRISSSVLASIYKSEQENDENNGNTETRRFVCENCAVSITSGQSVHFMMDQVFCSNVCRMQSLIDSKPSQCTAVHKTQRGGSYFAALGAQCGVEEGGPPRGAGGST